MVSRKAEKINQWIRPFQGREEDAHFLGFVDFFNRQQYYEAHEILEVLWLPARSNTDGAFYKGLIQLAGAFVHLQKGRLRPAAALFKLAQMNLGQYPLAHRRLDVASVLQGIAGWLSEIEIGHSTSNPFGKRNYLLLRLMQGGRRGPTSPLMG